MILSFAFGTVLAQSMGTEVTIYNQGFALVKEVRQLDLRSGRQNVAIENVAAAIEPTSVGIKSLGAADAFEVYEQNYVFDLINPIGILNKAVGSIVRFHRTLPNGTKEVLIGKLMSAPTGVNNSPLGTSYPGMVIQSTDGRVILDPVGEVEVESIPQGMISKPTLIWDLHANKAGQTPVELSYLTQQMSWNANYVLTLDEAQKSNLKGWVTLTNNSGEAYTDAKLKLLAGDVQRAQRPTGGFGGGGRAGAEMMKADNRFVEESLFEYHLYTLQRPATMKNKETKQISLLESPQLTTTKKLVVDSLRDYGVYYPNETEVGTGMIKPIVLVEFMNTKANGLGIPLPAGAVKVYQRDKSGSVQMLGEDSIQHTPREEKISLFVGRSFDVVASRKRVSFNWVGGSRTSTDEVFEIEVRNRKEVPETVHVMERRYAEWEILEKSMDFEKLDSNTMQFVVRLNPNEVKTIRYRVRTHW
ncbi:MAG TPA: hypothetical protein PKA27_06365 [Fimbriimonadaceae bacterium]|nr:hypothetical protein [Fimbriimonadaceae bacterium]